MPIIFSGAVVHVIVAVIVLTILTGAGIYVLHLLYVNSLQNEQPTDEHLDYFRELNLKGKLTDSEFRIIKEQISNRVASDRQAVTEADVWTLLARKEESRVRDDQKAGDDETRQWSNEAGDTALGH